MPGKSYEIRKKFQNVSVNKFMEIYEILWFFPGDSHFNRRENPLLIIYTSIPFLKYIYLFLELLYEIIYDKDLG